MGVSKLASFSNYGAAMVDVAAPGVGIKSSIPGEMELTVSGTSQVMIDGKTGWLVPPGDPAALTCAIREVLGDPARAAAMAAAGRARVGAQFNAIGQAEQLAALFGAPRPAAGVGAR